MEKQTKTTEYQREKQIKAMEDNKNNYIIMKYCFQRKEKYLRIFATKNSIK